MQEIFNWLSFIPGESKRIMDELLDRDEWPDGRRAVFA
jgi:predicted Fe-S protein YdhL (DUF1289 family)